MDNLLPILGIEAAVLGAMGVVARWMWLRFTARMEHDETELIELRDQYQQCLDDKMEFAQAVARLEERLDSTKRELERLRTVIEERN